MIKDTISNKKASIVDQTLQRINQHTCGEYWNGLILMLVENVDIILNSNPRLNKDVTSSKSKIPEAETIKKCFLSLFS